MKIKGFLVAINAEQKGGAPEWLHLLPIGELTTPDGAKYLVNQQSMDEVLAHWADRKIDMVIDYEHQTHKDVQAPAAGWIKELEARPDGIWGRVEWTKRGADYVVNKEYRYMSPVIGYEKATGRVIRLLDVALTNTPRINNYPAIINKLGGGKVNEFLDKLKAFLGLGESDGEEQTLSAVETLVSAFKELAGLDGKAACTAGELVKAMKAKLALNGDEGGKAALALNKAAKLLDLPDGATGSQIEGAIQGLKAGSGQAGDLAQELAEIKAELALNKAKDAVAAGLKAGKLAPAQKDWALKYAKSDLEGFTAYLKAAPQVIPVDVTLPGGTKGSAQRRLRG